MCGFGSIKIARCGSNLTFYFPGPAEPFSFIRVNYVPFCICQLAEMSNQPNVMLTSLFGYIVEMLVRTAGAYLSSINKL
jgi:hypothetical protein